MDERDEGGPPETGGGGGDRCPFCGAAAAGDSPVRIVPNRHGSLQVRRTGGRKLFGRERKEVFLQWFALTASIEFATEQAGVCRQTVSKHRLKDPEFEEAYRRAIELGTPDLHARLHAYMRGKPKLNIHGELEPPSDDDFDPQLAIQILREQHRMMERAGPEKALKRGRRPRIATNEEVEAALAKRLRAFQARVRAGAVPAPSDEVEGQGGAEGPLRQASGLHEQVRTAPSSPQPCRGHGGPAHPRPGEDL